MTPAMYRSLAAAHSRIATLYVKEADSMEAKRNEAKRQAGLAKAKKKSVKKATPQK